MKSIFTRTSILVVEDNPVMRSLFRQLLNALGMGGILAASDGETAKAIILKAELDIIITDYRIKPNSGIELAQWVRQDPASPNPDLPIIMTSAVSSPGQIIAAKNAGIDGFLLKPLNLNQLRQRLTAVLHAPRPSTRDAAMPPAIDLDVEEFSI